MRIVDKRRDYYDGVQAQGQDRDIQYIRTPEIIEMSMNGEKGKVPWPFPHISRPFFGDVYPIIYVVGFCGNIYPVVELNRVNEREYCVTVEQIDKKMEELLDASHLQQYQSNRMFSSNRQVFVNFFYQCSKKKGDYRKMFEDKRSPVFVASSGGGFGRHYNTMLEWNALLGMIHFQKLFPPYQAFQEIRMFMSNLAMPEKPIPQLSDADMAHSKGHGDKYSFRTAPGTKPGRKNKK